MPILFSVVAWGPYVLAKYASFVGSDRSDFAVHRTRRLQAHILSWQLPHSIHRIRWHRLPSDHRRQHLRFIGIVSAHVLSVPWRDQEAVQVTYGPQVLTTLPFAMNSEFSRVSVNEMKHCSESKDADTISKFYGELDELKEIMVQNGDSLAHREERLELPVNSVALLTTSRNLRQAMWWKSMKVTIFITLLVDVKKLELLYFASPSCRAGVRSSIRPQCGVIHIVDLWPKCVMEEAVEVEEIVWQIVETTRYLELEADDSEELIEEHAEELMEEHAEELTMVELNELNKRKQRKLFLQGRRKKTTQKDPCRMLQWKNIRPQCGVIHIVDLWPKCVMEEAVEVEEIVWQIVETTRYLELEADDSEELIEEHAEELMEEHAEELTMVELNELNKRKQRKLFLQGRRKKTTQKDPCQMLPWKKFVEMGKLYGHCHEMASGQDRDLSFSGDAAKCTSNTSVQRINVTKTTASTSKNSNNNSNVAPNSVRVTGTNNSLSVSMGQSSSAILPLLAGNGVPDSATAKSNSSGAVPQALPVPVGNETSVVAVGKS
ncbi:unnamed protein product, partial [Notodromas monacha]